MADSPIRQLWARRLWTGLVLAALSYGILEGSYSTLYRYGIVDRPAMLAVSEDSGRTIQFDPIRGYRLLPEPSRFARITHGELEYLGTYRGNAQGFPDRDDFTVRRRAAAEFRLAVFGDSFTAAQYIDLNWPGRVEDLMREAGGPMRLLNFSVDGGGLANWWSVLTRIVFEEDYELDGVVFAVFDDPRYGNLYRGLRLADHRGRQVLSGLVASWDPDTWPNTIEEARPLMDRQPKYVLSHAEFERTLAGEWRPDLPRPLRPYVLLKLSDGLGLTTRDSGLMPVRNRRANRLGDPQYRLIDSIAAALAERELPALVVRVASRGLAVSGRPPSKDVREFADRLGAPLVDGAQVFADLTTVEIRRLFFPYDGHWNQEGSDRFAALMSGELATWHDGGQ